jgi:flavin reductase (DIM6/NTAB) family NADH-FMN oxidoreductase RutF
MEKVSLGKVLPAYAMPVCLIGSTVAGKANFCTIAWFSIIDDEPPMIGIVMGKKRRTRDGMEENGCFSVNIPGQGMVKAVDHCGITSGFDIDKSGVFKIFTGRLRTAPMIEECPLTMECSVKRTIEFEGTDMVVGEIEGAYASGDLMVKGKVDQSKMMQLLYSTHGPYWSLGKKVADAFSVGKTYQD